jgi:fructokinase
MVDLNARPRAIADADHYRARLQEFVARADIVKASTEDLQFLHPGETPAAGAQRMVADGVAVVLLTDGGDPVQIVTASGSRVVPVPAVDVVDTVGAGDAFGAATLTAWVDRGRGPAALRAIDDDTLDALEDAVRFGARVSAITCTRTGADPPRRAEIV